MSSEASRLRHRFLEAARQFRAGKIPLNAFADQFFPVSSGAEEPTESTPYRRLSPRPVDCHKGTFGHVLVVAGSLGMSGAAALAGMAALRAGAGLVTVATTRSAQPLVAQAHPCLMTVGLPEDAAGCLAVSGLANLRAVAARATVVALGPGLGQSEDVRGVVRELFRAIPLPMVVDADGLNALAAAESLPPPGGPRVYTPHPGELQRLARTKAGSRTTLEAAARAWLQAHAAEVPQVLVLKGHRSYVCTLEREHHNTTGSPVLATAGSGDVLTGVIAGLLAQRLSPWDAAALGAAVHGYAGELAARTIGPVGVVASDLLPHLPAALSARGLAEPQPAAPP